MTVIIACRRYRLRDLALMRLGIVSAGHELRVMVLPWAVPRLLLAAAARFFGRSVHLVLSDKAIGDTLLARLFGCDCTRMMWNYADEWPSAGIRLPRHRVCFFPEADHAVESFVFAPQPCLQRSRPGDAPRHPIAFVGDVTVDLALPRGAGWWRERFRGLYDTFGYTFYLRPEHEALIRQALIEAGDRRLAHVLAKNLLRLWIVERLAGHFGDRLVLLGSNWRRFGLPAQPSAYSAEQRMEFYRAATVNLDCGSKSGDGALYPRSSELISFAGGLLQVRCADTAAIFGERAHEFTFDTEDRLVAGVEARLAESQDRRAERDAWLADHLRKRQSLMQHSIDRMLNEARKTANDSSC